MIRAMGSSASRVGGTGGLEKGPVWASRVLQRAPRAGPHWWDLFLALGIQLGTVPSAELLSGLGLHPFTDEQGDQWQAALAPSTMLSSIVPLLTAFAGAVEPREKAESKPCCYYGQGPPHSAVKTG